MLVEGRCNAWVDPGIIFGGNDAGGWGLDPMQDLRVNPGGVLWGKAPLC